MGSALLPKGFEMKSPRARACGRCRGGAEGAEEIKSVLVAVAGGGLSFEINTFFVVIGLERGI